MAGILHILALLILSIVSIVVAETYDYELLVHHPSQTSGHALANVSVDSTALRAKIAKYNTSDIDITSSGWCLSLVSSDTSLECFNYIKSIDITGGDLFISVDPETKHIQSANYISKPDAYKLSIKIENAYLIADPQPRLRLGAATDPTEPAPEDQEDLKKKKREEYKKTKKEQKDANGGKDVKNGIIDDEMMRDFQEIVKPKGIYSDNKTFIEKYWMYIIPPVLLFFVVGNVGAGTE